MIVKHFGCTAIHNKALYKCLVHSLIHSFKQNESLQTKQKQNKIKSNKNHPSNQKTKQTKPNNKTNNTD